MKKFIPTQSGWVSPKTPPVNHNSVVVLVYEDNIYYELIGYHEEGEWHIYHMDDETKEGKVCGWFPIPYSPNNN
jgi:hypothetical protein